MACLYAATHPERTRALVLYAAWARARRPATNGPARPRSARSGSRRSSATGARATRLDVLAPSEAGDAELRAGSPSSSGWPPSPGGCRAPVSSIGEYDVRDVLPSIRVPTLVMHRRDDSLIDSRHSRYIAEHIPGAKLRELRGLGQPAGRRRQRRASSTRSRSSSPARARRREPDRVLATVMFTDIVGSTERAARARRPRAGASCWSATTSSCRAPARPLPRHARSRRRRRLPRHVRRPGPRDPLRAGDRRRRSASWASRCRAGLHTGECEVMGDDVGGHRRPHRRPRRRARRRRARCSSRAPCKDLVVGSGIDFADRGEHELKGVPGEWRVFRVV